MKGNTTKVFFRYETEEIDEKVPVMENNKVKREKGKKLFTLTGKKKIVRKVDGKIEAIAINVTTGEERARREVQLRHGDEPNKIVGRKYAFKKLMDHMHQNQILPGNEINLLWKSFGSTCKQPQIKLAY